MTYALLTEKVVQFRNLSSQYFSENDGFATEKTYLAIKFTWKWENKILFAERQMKMRIWKEWK